MYDYDVEITSVSGVVSILESADTGIEVFEIPAVTVLEVSLPGSRGPQGIQGVQGPIGDLEIEDVEAALEPPVNLTVLFENALA